jgi:hypothetical protein
VRATGGFTVVGGDLDDHAGFAVVGHRLTLASGVGAEVLGVLLQQTRWEPFHSALEKAAAPMSRFQTLQ